MRQRGGGEREKDRERRRGSTDRDEEESVVVVVVMMIGVGGGLPQDGRVREGIRQGREMGEEEVKVVCNCERVRVRAGRE